MDEQEDFTAGRSAERRRILRARGVNDPCEVCGGLGARMYSSGSTWRGGMGVASMTADVCDICWGSGDKYHQGVDLRTLEAARADWEQEQCLQWLSDKLGVNLTCIRQRILDLANLADKQANRRKLPEGEDYFWWHSNWSALASILRKVCEAKP